jgi:hypothetical protein
MGVPTATAVRRHTIDGEHPFHRERNMSLFLGEYEIAPRIANFRQGDFRKVHE